MTAGMYLAVNTAVKKIALSRHSRPTSVLPYQTALVMVKELHAYLRHGHLPRKFQRLYPAC